MKNKRLFLLHDAPGHAGIWGPVLAMLPDDLEVICPTLEWFGPEKWKRPGEQFSTEAHCEQICDLLKEHPDGGNYVAAWSYSTHPLLLALIKHPELITSALLYEPGLPTYLDTPQELDHFQHSAAHGFTPIISAMQEQGAAAAVIALFDSSGGAGCFESMSEERQALYLQSQQMMPLLLGGGQHPANIQSADLKQIKTPVWVALGDQSPDHFAVPSRKVAATVADGHLRMQENCDHMMPEKDPAQFARLLREWLEV